MTDLLASTRAHLQVAQAHLTQAKAQYDTAKADYDTAKKLHETVVIAHATSVTANGSQKLCDLCSKIDFQGLFKHRTASPKTETSRHGIGDLYNVVENKATCPCCRFLLEACELGRQAGAVKLHSVRDGRHSTIYLVNDRSPWYKKAGVAADMRWHSYFWLQLGLPTDTGEPHVCISLNDLTSSDNPDAGTTQSSSPRMRDPIEAFNGSVNYDIVRSWLHTCETDHGDGCKVLNKNKSDDIKFSLIDVQTREIVPASPGHCYVALSYVWGKGAQTSYRYEVVNAPVEQVGGSEDADRTQRKLRLPYPAPRTIEDAMIFVKRVGYNYLWTDLFCIDQDDQVSKMEQILQMDKIYHSAFFTIVALDGEDADWGLPGVPRPLGHTNQPVLNLGIGRLSATYIFSICDHAGKSNMGFACMDLAGTIDVSTLCHPCK